VGVELIEAMGKLREGDREVLLLVGWDGLTSEEASMVLGISVGAVRVRLHRARKRLRCLLESGEPSEKQVAVLRTCIEAKGNPTLPGLEEH
jgi:RNA polymerase sigma-70 factor (ECF subfamily)